MPEPVVDPTITVINPADYVAWEKAEKAGENVVEKTIPAEGGEKPPETPAAEPKESTSEPAGEPATAKAVPEPEAGTPKEPESENKAEEENAGMPPKFARRLLKQQGREIRELREQTDALRAELAAKKTAEPAAAQPVREPSATAPAEPKEEDFETTAAYTRALTLFHAEQIAERKIADFQASVKRQLDAEDQEARNRQIAAAQAKIDANWVEQVNAGRDEHDDFDEVVLQNPQLAGPEIPYMNRFVQRSKVGHKVAYHLGSHPEEFHRIAALLPEDQISELTIIALQFSEKPKAPESKPKDNDSHNFQPTTRIGGGSSMSAVKDINDPAVIQDYPAWERLEMERTKRR